MAWSSPSKPLSPGLEDSLVSSPPASWLHSPFTLHAMEEEEERAEMEEAIEEEVRFRKDHGLPELEEKEKKKKGDYASDEDVLRGDLPPQSPL